MKILPLLISVLITPATVTVIAISMEKGDTISTDNNNNNNNIALESESTTSKEAATYSSQAIKPNLPFGDINLLVVSDVHSFVGGHPHEPDRDADYGDLYSFHERLQDYLNSNENNETGDLWLLNNGDWLHGTGLAMDGNATHLLPIINAMPWDVLSMGNHEAMYTDVLRDMKTSMLPEFPGKYITSNVLWTNSNCNDNIGSHCNTEPFGERYQLLKGRNSTVLVFGFLYDMVRPSETIEIVPVEEVIEEDWFRDALRNDDETYDAIIVMAHMDYNNPLVDAIYEKIREYVKHPKMPVQFITGHSHTRSHSQNIKRDQFVHKLTPGGLFDTIGWVTMPKFDKANVLDTNILKNDATPEFSHRFLNTSKSFLHSTLGLVGENNNNSIPLRTTGGNKISQLIHDTQTKLELNEIVACPKQDYFRNISIHDENSLWKLWKDHVVKTQIFEKDTDRVMLVSKKTFRYDLRGRGINKHDDDAMTLDDVIAIAPFMERVIYVGDVPDWMIRRMNNTFNSLSYHNIIPDYVLAGDLEETKTAETYQLYTHEVDVPKIKSKLEKFNFHDFRLEYTGNRDTLYWLDYVRNAFQCKGLNAAEQENIMKKKPYFYDPNELEEEDTDGKLTFEDIDGNDDVKTNAEDFDGNGGNDIEWTLPPGDKYLGYIPGKGEKQKITNDSYERYKSKNEIEKEKEEERLNEQVSKHHSDLKSQLKERKKTQKSIIKGFALTFACVLLLIPVACMIMQITGQNNDNLNDTYDGIGVYDKGEVRSLRRKRRNRGSNKYTEGDNSSLSIHARPVKEIEII